MRVLITGGRDWSDDERFAQTLDRTCYSAPRDERVTIIHGNNGNADALAEQYAERRGHNVWRFPAEWAFYGGPIAGGIRNQEMLDTIRPDIVLCFPTSTSRGTWDMYRRAQRMGIQTFVTKERRRRGT
jgi:YspA, cpYpsA-related SLOG family